MSIKSQIKTYIDGQDAEKRADLQALHENILQILPKGKLWFLDGKDAKGKIVTNPNIGYGQYTIQYKDGTTKEFYQIGLSANTAGISVYIMGLGDKKYLPEHFGTVIGKASVTGYCIKFKAVKDINIGILKKAMLYGLEQTTKP